MVENRAGATLHAEHGCALRPHGKRREWFVIPLGWLPAIAAAPSVQLDNGLPVVHLSHLPLLAETFPEAQNFLSELRSRTRLQISTSRDRDAFDDATSKLGWKLRPYQHDGREFIQGRRGT